MYLSLEGWATDMGVGGGGKRVRVRGFVIPGLHLQKLGLAAAFGDRDLAPQWPQEAPWLAHTDAAVTGQGSRAMRQSTGTD